jgi:hypothetical protein
MRLRWHGTVAVALTGAGFAFGQPAVKPTATPAALAATPAPAASEKMIVLREEGKPERKCIIQKTWKRPDGSLAHQVRILDTGEVVTIMDGQPGPDELVGTPSGAPQQQRSWLGRVFHREKTPPATVDGLPADAVMTSQPTVMVSGPTAPASKAPVVISGPPPAGAGSPDPLMSPDLGGVRVREVKDPSAPKSGGVFGWFRKGDKATAVQPVTATVPAPAPTPVPAAPVKAGVETQSRAGHAVAVEELTSPVLTPAPQAVQPVVLLAAQPPVTKAPEGQADRELLKTLQEALGPSQRERAAVLLVSGPGRSQPEVTAALIRAAQSDPAPSVRTCCIHCLSLELHCCDAAFAAALTALKADADPDVRRSAERALAQLGK